jgi:hypothetical protein
LLFVLLGLRFGPVGVAVSGPLPPSHEVGTDQAQAERTVFLGGNLSDEDLITLTAAVAAGDHPGVVLLDSPGCTPYHKSFLAAFRPERVVPVGTFPEGITELERRLGVTAAPAQGVAWQRGPPTALWKTLFRPAGRAVVCPAEPRGLLLQAACLAGVLRAPLVVTRNRAEEARPLRQCLEDWQTREVFVAGSAGPIYKGPEPVRVVRLADEAAVAACYLRYQRMRGPIHTLVVANPGDTRKGLGRMSCLAPWVVLQRRAALLLTNEDGTDVDEVVRAALKNPKLAAADNLILLADLQAVPIHRRPNPIPADKDPTIELEPLTPTGTEPFTFATGRLFNEDPGVVLLNLAQQRLLAERRTPRKALVVSNAGGGLPLLETFSRSTAKELANRGYQTTTLCGSAVTRDEVRRLLPEHDIFLWEGHHSTLIKDFGLPEWDEPLPPALVFLQSCLALTEGKAQPLLRRGAIGVVGSSTRTYSGSGGACSLAFFDALLYDEQTLGGSLRQAKNFLLAYALLKEKRLGTDARLTGANLRAAWAFTLWGDPTVKLPHPQAPPGALAPVRYEVRGNTLVLALPAAAHDQTTTARYKAQMLPNARLAGLLSKTIDDDGQPLIPFVFAEVRLPKAPPGQAPRLRSKVPDSRWVFVWDGRRKCGYLLVTPRAKEAAELRFRVEWEEAGAPPPANPFRATARN